MGEFDLLLNNLREKVRVKQGQKAEASVGIMDSQSVRWGDNRSLNGIDGNKKGEWALSVMLSWTRTVS